MRILCSRFISFIQGTRGQICAATVVSVPTRWFSRARYPSREQFRHIIFVDVRSPAFLPFGYQTIDLAGNIKFGPDVEHLSEKELSGLQNEAGMADDQDLETPDWWQEHLAPSPQRKEEMTRAIQDYVSTQFLTDRAVSLIHPHLKAAEH